MWTNLGLFIALSLTPAQTGNLQLTNVRSTYGLLGPVREHDRILPGDAYWVAFDIDNVRTNANGEVRYSMGMEVLDSKNKTQFKQDPKDLQAFNSLGGHHLPAFAHVDIGLDQPPGQYTLRVTVTDQLAKATQTLSRRFEVLNPAFGLTRLSVSFDPDGNYPAATTGVTGQTFWVNFMAVGVQRGGQKKEADLVIEMQVLDDNNQPVLNKPFPGEVKDLPKENVAPMQFLLALNRAGKFTVRLRATDRVANKTSELAFPITVLEPRSDSSR